MPLDGDWDYCGNCNEVVDLPHNCPCDPDMALDAIREQPPYDEGYVDPE